MIDFLLSPVDCNCLQYFAIILICFGVGYGVARLRDFKEDDDEWRGMR